MEPDGSEAAIPTSHPDITDVLDRRQYC